MSSQHDVSRRESSKRDSAKVRSNRAVLEALGSLSHSTAQEIYDWLNSHKQPDTRTISLTSVYRALNTLVEQGQAKPLHFNDGQVRYELNNKHTHHHHFICIKCGHIEVIDLCPIHPWLEDLKSQYHIQYHNFELFGTCNRCFAELSQDAALDAPDDA